MKFPDITNGYSLAAFALFLVFSLTAAATRKGRGRAWQSKVFLALAVTAVIAGIALAFRSDNENSRAATKTTSPSTVQQETKGDVSPAISGVQGNVSISSGGRLPAPSAPPTAVRSAPVTPSSPITAKQQTGGAVSPAISNVNGSVTIESANGEKKP